MNVKHFPIWGVGSGFALLIILLTVFGSPLSIDHQWSLLQGTQAPESFDDFSFLFGHLPRIAMALIVGATLGLVGSLMQQLTQNPLTSPLTLGSSSGAWLALIIMNVWFAQYVNDYGDLAAMVGAMLAFGLILAIVGLNNMTGLPIVVAGMVVNLLLGAIATGIILLNEQFAQNIFMWGAGDLAQNGWDTFTSLAPQLLIGLPILFFAPRALSLLRLGKEGASARGLSVLPTFFVLMTTGIWLASAIVSSIGVIGFIGLIAPNIARAIGARTARQELVFSMILGAGLLFATDRMAFWLTQYTNDVVTSGVTAALIGAPALVWFSRRQLKAQDNLAFILPTGGRNLSFKALSGIGVSVVTILLLNTFADFSSGSFEWHWLSDYQWQIRQPRLLTAVAAGASLAIAGVLLQRLIYNPLASPDILGVSAGATLALVSTTVLFANATLSNNWLVAALGSIAVLLVLIALARKHQFAPSTLILTGIALTALLDAVIQFCLAKGTQDSYRILLWLAGSTYRVTNAQSLALLASSLLLLSFALISSRWLTLLSVGRAFALARGVPLNLASLIILTLVALLCATTTATMGPIAFIGLIAPHLAIMLGARSTRSQILCAAILGATLLLWADWLGQSLLYPAQIAAGTLVSILGGLYFITLLVIGRFKKP
ncbi:MAG: Fe(3+)-hydroxamate ABC transporter permease FhuB [Marinomonas sp.]|nr:MAG: Fe(3+)-hydroxamate ABC transporter permease FhuB [Marinomonas sp.]